jgi:hypothetical protein
MSVVVPGEDTQKSPRSMRAIPSIRSNHQGIRRVSGLVTLAAVMDVSPFLCRRIE